MKKLRTPKFILAVWLLVLSCSQEPLTLEDYVSRSREESSDFIASLPLQGSAPAAKPNPKEQPFKLVSHNLILIGRTRVSPNRKHFFLKFSHPVGSLPKDAVKINGTALNTHLSSDKSVLVASIDVHDMETLLKPNSPLKLFVSSEIKNDLNRGLEEFVAEYQTEETANLREHVVKYESVIGFENYADVELKVEYFAFARFRFGFAGQEMDCLGSECPHIEAINPTENKFKAVSGLPENSSFDYELEVEDLFGRVETKKGHFETSRVAQIAINEIFANPLKTPGKTDSNSEFIELCNYGNEAVDLADFSIEVDSKTCSLSNSGIPVHIPANSFILLVGKKFEPDLFGLPDGPYIHRMPGQTICGNLRNWPLPMITIRDAGKRPIDRFWGMPDINPKGQSIERLNPSEKNGKERYCYSPIDMGPTPLRINNAC